MQLLSTFGGHLQEKQGSLARHETISGGLEGGLTSRRYSMTSSSPSVAGRLFRAWSRAGIPAATHHHCRRAGSLPLFHDHRLAQNS
jgi:hypothetical protein